MASPANNFDFPHFSPPPPPHVVPPPPPHVVPPPPSPSPDNHSTVIVIVFVSFGCFFFLAFLAVALCCFIKKRKKKTVQETDIIRADEHLKIKEAIVQGPHGQEAVVLSIDDDVHVDEVIRKNEVFGEGMHAKSAHYHPNLPITLEEGPSPSSSSHHHLEHKS
ncbi:protein TRACHEARY ELEMENT DIFFERENTIATION-RELATED 7A-like [Cornus florida]|uniref:protein TRACHEARY ELEMENT DIFFERENTIATION-RELATED 7A-like n=1 Tax=Cornus florida TaxID=4283 RepID=UPI00289E00BE|nr:protein TRACHEARY ELEMENT DIFFERENTIATION-RELATED 7A-like [Cornus florida]